MRTTSVSCLLALTGLIVAVAASPGTARASPSPVSVPGPAEAQSDGEVPGGPPPAPRPALPVPALPEPALPVLASPAPAAAPPPTAAAAVEAAAAASPVAAKPDGPPLSVLIVYRAGSFVARERAEAVARSLDAGGIDAVGFARLKTRPEAARIGFVYGADGAAADLVEQAAGTAFGLPAPVRLAPADAHTTRPGTIEIDVDG